MLRHCSFRMLAVVLACQVFSAAGEPFSAMAADNSVDVVIYGATPGGIAAAVAVGKSSRRVLLVEPTGRIGGLVTCGLSHTDFHSLESLSGTYLDFSQRVLAHYTKTYGKDSPQVETCFQGNFSEPKVSLQVFNEMLKAVNVQVVHKFRLKSLVMDGGGESRKLQSATFESADGERERLSVQAGIFIDGTYEGDLMALAGVPWRVGREGQSEYGESLAPAETDHQLQAYNFRLIATRDPDNRVTPTAPPGYRREDFVDILPILASGKIQKVFDYPRHCIFKAQTPPLPNGKYDINDVSRGVVRLSLPGHNLNWPDGDEEVRARIFAEHLRDQVGLLYFLQNDDAVPEPFRSEAREWGWCRDEFVDSDHLPPQLYIREARRMVGQHIFIQQDSEQAPEDIRAVLHRDSIATGDYGNNCHGTLHTGPRFSGEHSGEFYNAVPPYQIPYGVLIPRETANLIVPVAASSSHVGFCALRLEPIWMSLGQAAGHAAVLALEQKGSVQNVDVPALQRRLHADGSATIYVSDVLPGSPDFAAVQWWGTQGGFHGIEARLPKNKMRGAKIIGVNSQYNEAAPGHTAQLDLVLTPELSQAWRQLAQELDLPVEKLPQADQKTTRGDFIRAAAGLVQAGT